MVPFATALVLVSACGAAPPPPPASPAPASPAPASPASPRPADSSPAGLACLAAAYVGTPVHRDDGWALALPDGTLRAWDDGRVKTFDEALAAPDLQDTLSIPYVAGPIAPVPTVDHDPGRIRDDVLLAATFGGSAEAVEAALVPVTFVGQAVRVHPRAAEPLTRVSTRLEAAIATDPRLAPYVTGALGGTFAWRPIVNTTRRSAHSYGIAIDIVTAHSNYWEWSKTADGVVVWANRIPQAVVDAFEAEHFAWGGRWYHYDTMHFEYRPELFDPACRG